MNRNDNGIASERSMFKVRRKRDKKYFTPGYRTVTWDNKGKTYATAQAARSAARNATVMGGAGKVKINPARLEIAEFALREVAKHEV